MTSAPLRPAPRHPAPRYPAPLRHLLTAVMFLTRIPVPRGIGADPADLARSTPYFPLVGVVVGLAGGVVIALGTRVWSPWIAAALSTAATVRLTGAFHEDALADACDGFGGGWEPARVLAIMKDSRIGSYGAVALTLVLVLKVGALTDVATRDPGLAARALVAGHVLGRWSSLPLIRWLPYVRDDAAGGTGKPFAAGVTDARLAIGSVIAVGATAVALAPLGVTAVLGTLALAAAVTALAARYFRRRIGGMTGDCLGAANQLVELVTYLSLASAWVRP